jgi:hypothetical protein
VDAAKTGNLPGDFPPLMRFAEVPRVDNLLLLNFCNAMPSLLYLLVVPEGKEVLKAMWKGLLNEDKQQQEKQQREGVSKVQRTGPGSVSRGNPQISYHYDEQLAAGGGRGAVDRQPWGQCYTGPLEFAKKHKVALLNLHRLGRTALVRLYVEPRVFM